MASFDETIPPGRVGKITLSVHTKDYQGNILKNARVYSNDPNNKQITLTLMAFVNVPIHLTPNYVYFTANEGESVTSMVQIKAGLNKPLILTPDKFNLSEKLNYRLEQIEEGRKFMIRFTNRPSPAQTYQGFLTLKTNYPEKPMISIEITGVIVNEKESADLSPEPSPPGPSSPKRPSPQVPGQRSDGQNIPPGSEPLSPVVDPKVSPPPGEKPLSPVVDPKVSPPPGEKPREPEPSLEQETENASPSGIEEENTLEQPNQNSSPNNPRPD